MCLLASIAYSRADSVPECVGECEVQPSMSASTARSGRESRCIKRIGTRCAAGLAHMAWRVGKRAFGCCTPITKRDHSHPSQRQLACVCGASARAWE